MSDAAQAQDVWFVPSPGEVYRGAVQADARRLRLSLVDFGVGIDRIATVARGPDGSLLLVSAPEQAGGASALWRLVRPTPAPSAARLAAR